MTVCRLSTPLHPLHCPPPPSAAAGAASSDAPKTHSFFFSSIAGVVFYADDFGNSPDTGINVGSPLSVMEFYASKKRLVVVTNSLMMTQVEVCVRVCMCVYVCV